MGYWKNKQLEEEARGYGESDKLICIECVGDYSLKNYIDVNGNVDSCSYCEQNNKCICLSDIMPLVILGILQEYEDANGCVGWNSKDGGFVGVKVWDTYDFIDEILADEMGIDTYEINEDLFDIMNETTWCQRDPYGERPDDEMFYTWETFSKKLIKNNGEDKDGKYNDITETICKSIILHKLVTEIDLNTAIYRSRFHEKRVNIQSAEQLASPKTENANNNRMSKCGCPMFYGSFDKDTCFIEVGEQAEFNITAGVFYNQRKLRVIDFTKLKEISYVSLFDIERSKERISLSFMRQFNDDISKPVDKNDNLQNKYIPTQFLTSYFRDSFKTEEGDFIDGILYNSSILKNKECICLFLSNEDASDERDRILWLDHKSLETYSYDEYLNIKIQITNEEKNSQMSIFD